MTADESPISIDLAREPDFRIRALQVCPSTREVCGDQREVLEPRIMQVLVALARRRGEVVSRDDLIAACWAGRVVGEDAIGRAVAGVRRMGEAQGAFVVETFPRVGYRLSEVGLPAEQGRGLRPLWRWGAVALAGAIALGAVGLKVLPNSAPPVRIAVLPFEAIGHDARAQSVAASLLDDLLTSLSSQQVQSVSRSDSLTLRGPGAEAAIRKLGVNYLLDGSVVHEGGQLKASVHLADVRSHLILWSADITGTSADPAAIERQVAGRAVDVTRWLMVPGVRRARVGPEALAAYLEAGDEMQNEDVTAQAAVAAYRRSVALAPRFSYAHTGLGFALLRSLQGQPTDAAQALLEAAEVEARRGIKLDPNNGECWLLMEYFQARNAWKAREDLGLRGLRADPDQPYLPRAQSLLLQDVGRTSEAISMARRAAAVEPYWRDAQLSVARMLATAGQTREAQAAAYATLRALPTDPVAHLNSLDVALISGNSAMALDLLDDPEAQPPGEEAVLWRSILSAGAISPAARATLARRVSAAAESGQFRWTAAVIALGRLGDLDAAFNAAERAFPSRDIMKPWALDPESTMDALYAPSAEAMRRDPRFMMLAKRLGLADYWRTSGHWPDFCADPILPYDCRVEAMRVSDIRRDYTYPRPRLSS